jgi:UDP-N-acetylmuramate dehydrogenase
MSSVGELVAEGTLKASSPLGPLTTYKAGGPALYLAEIADRDALGRLIESGVMADLPVLVVGRGSNLVVSDRGFEGVAVHLGAGFGHVSYHDTTVEAGAAVPLPRLARSTAERGLTGLEFFVGVPGSVGGAVRQNAGCFGSETRDRLVDVDLVDLVTGEESQVPVGELDLSYRHSSLQSSQIVIVARFATTAGDAEESMRKIREITRWRRDNQPGGTLNAGSVFKNPPGTTAGELIDSLGLKGLSVGGVSVSRKHANFFVAGPGADADDIHRLVQLVKDRVFEETGTILEPEIQFVGFDT